MSSDEHHPSVGVAEHSCVERYPGSWETLGRRITCVPSSGAPVPAPASSHSEFSPPGWSGRPGSGGQSPSLSSIFRLGHGLIFASILLPISACPGNTSRFSILVPGPDQTRDPKVLPSSWSEGRNRGFAQRWHCRGRGSIKATGGGRQPTLPRQVVGAPRGSVIQFQPK